MCVLGLHSAQCLRAEPPRAMGSTPHPWGRWWRSLGDIRYLLMEYSVVQAAPAWVPASRARWLCSTCTTSADEAVCSLASPAGARGRLHTCAQGTARCQSRTRDGLLHADPRSSVQLRPPCACAGRGTSGHPEVSGQLTQQGAACWRGLHIASAHRLQACPHRVLHSGL